VCRERQDRFHAQVTPRELKPFRQLFEIVNIPWPAAGSLVGLEIGERNKVNRQPVVNGGIKRCTTG
jgi:hypothetical protein